MSLIALPESAATSKRKVPYLYATLTAFAVVAIVWAGVALTTRSAGGGGVGGGQFYTIVPMDMDITVTKDGELQAVTNADITSNVEGQNTILEIVKEGTFVHKGDVVCKLDSSDIERKIAPRRSAPSRARTV